MNIKHFTLKIMDYKEKYEKALEKAKEYNNVYKDHTMMSYAKGALEDIFPELADSEDEKIRKGIIELVKQSSEILNKKNQERMLAWLENIPYTIDNEKREADQKAEENKGNIGGISSYWSEEYEKMFLEIMRDIDAVEEEWGCVCDSEMKWLESIKQKLKG